MKDFPLPVCEETRPAWRVFATLVILSILRAPEEMRRGTLEIALDMVPDEYLPVCEQLIRTAPRTIEEWKQWAEEQDRKHARE